MQVNIKLITLTSKTRQGAFIREGAFIRIKVVFNPNVGETCFIPNWKAWPIVWSARLAGKKSRVRLLPGHMSERFFRSNRPGYPHPVSSELENSGIRAVVGDCSVTECRRWRQPYQTGKTVHVHAKHYKHNEDGCTAPGVCGNGSVSLSRSGNVVTRIGIHTHTQPVLSKLYNIAKT